MSILVDKNTRLLVQGITGKAGAFHARGCRDYGTNIVAGVTPGRGGELFDTTIPIFDTVAEARKETGCNATMIFVPAAGAADAILEAADADIDLIICITEGIPIHDMMRVKFALTATSSSTAATQRFATGVVANHAQHLSKCAHVDEAQGARSRAEECIEILDEASTAATQRSPTGVVVNYAQHLSKCAHVDEAQGARSRAEECIEILDEASTAATQRFATGVAFSKILIGPNCPGIITPGACKIGIMPGYIHEPGCIGVISRSGTLTYEAVWQLTSRGLGQSTCIGIGGDPIHGMSHTDALKLFAEDPGTEAIVIIGEIGGTEEEEAAHWAQQHCKKPIAAFIAGATAPEGRRMGHAGAIIQGSQGTAHGKKQALRNAGIAVADSPADIASTLIDLLKKRKKFTFSKKA